MNTAMESRPLFRSEALKEFRQLVEHFAVVAGVPNPLIQIPLVIDASIVQGELRSRLHSRCESRCEIAPARVELIREQEKHGPKIST